MKLVKFIFIFAVCIFSASMVIGQQATASISFDKTQYDFGKVKEEGGPISYEFPFTNTGNQPLVISQVVASCGCTSPDWTKQPVPPGGKGFVKATYDPANRPGQFNKSLTVMSNASGGNVVLWIQGEVLEKVKTIEDLYPYKLGDIRMKSNHLAFVKVYKGQQSTLLMEVINTSTNPATITFSNVPAHLILKPPPTLQPNEKGVIEATYDADKKNDWGFLIDRVDVAINGVPVQDTYLTISATVEEDFSKLTPDQLDKAPVARFDESVYDFGSMKQNASVEHDFVFTNAGKSDLIIRKVTSSCGCTAVQPKDNVIKPGTSSSVKAIFSSGNRSGKQSKAITIITNDPKQPQIILRVTGNVEGTGS